MIGRLLSSLSVACLASSASAFAPSAHHWAGFGALRVSFIESYAAACPLHEQPFWAICSGIDADDTQKIHFLKVETHRSDLPSTSSYHAVEMSARRLRAVPVGGDEQMAAESEVSFSELDGSGVRIGVLRTRWNDEHVSNLVDGIKVSFSFHLRVNTLAP